MKLGCRTLAAVLVVVVISFAGTVRSVANPTSPSSDGFTNKPVVFGEPMVQVQTGVATIIGVGPDSSKPAIPVSSIVDFEELVSTPSPSLTSAVQQFFFNGGEQAFIKGASDSTASAIIEAAESGIPAGADLVLAADLYMLEQSDWLSAAVALGSAASNSLAIALLDPPLSVVESATDSSDSSDSLSLLTSLGSDLKAASGAAAGSILLFASNLESPIGSTGATSPSYAGLIAGTDGAEGFWNAPNGFADSVLGWRPQFAFSQSDGSVLSQAGLNPLMFVPGRGTSVISARLLSGMNDFLSVKRTLNTVQATITNGLNEYVFAPNDQETWSTVIQATSGYLTELFMKGALFGANAQEAFRVDCGVGTTMTDDDVLNGFMILSVGLAVNYPSEFEQISVKQVMQTQSS